MLMNYDFFFSSRILAWRYRFRTYESAQREGYLDRVKARRKIEADRLKVTAKPVTVGPAPSAGGPTAAPLLPRTGYDGLDDWGQRSVTLGTTGRTCLVAGRLAG